MINLKKFFFYIALIAIVLAPKSIFALERENEEFIVVSKTEKYYKTTTVDSGIKSYSNISDTHYKSYTEEVTEEEFNNSNNSQVLSSGDYGYVETNYKKLTTYILQNGNKFRYQTVLNWKTIPKVRSYDIIAIGHYASVKPLGNVFFNQKYCYSSNECYTSTAYIPQTFSSGSSATFKLPTGNVSSMTQTFYFDLQKAVDATIVQQVAAGDYAHAVTGVNLIQAKDFTVSTLGISFKTSAINSYDDIQPAKVTWSGSW